MKIIEQTTNKIRHSLKDLSDSFKDEYKNHEVLYKRPDKYVYRKLISKYTPNLGLSILGVKGAGKSCLYSYLKLCNKKMNGDSVVPADLLVIKESTNYRKDIGKLIIHTKEGYNITINEGKDDSGADEKVSGVYKDAVEHSNVIIYLVPSYKLEEDEEDFIKIRKKILAQLYLIYFFINLKETNWKKDKEELEKKKKKTREDKENLKKVKAKLNLGTHVFIIPTCKNKRRTITDDGIKDFFDNSLSVTKKDEGFYNFMFGIDAKKVKFLDMIEMVKGGKQHDLMPSDAGVESLNMVELDEMRHKLFGYIVEIIIKQKRYYK